MPLLLDDHVTPTTVYHIPGTGPLFYFIPGNPGLSEFYGPYLEALKQQTTDSLGLDLELLCPSHIGFDTLSARSFGLSPGDTSYTLDDQIKHKISLLQDWVQRNNRGSDDSADTHAGDKQDLTTTTKVPKREVILMGHSVGAWMAQRIAVAFKDDETVDIKLVGLVTPTLIDIAKSDRGSKLVSLDKVTDHPGYYLGRASQLLSWTVSKPLLRRLVSYVLSNPSSPASVETAIDAAVSLISKPRIVRQAIDMGKEEMHRIGSELEAPDIKGFWDPEMGYRIWGFFVAEDHWVSPATRQTLVEAFGQQKYAHIDFEVDQEGVESSGDGSELDSKSGPGIVKIAHSFCVRQYNEVATLTAAQIKRAFA